MIENFKQINSREEFLKLQPFDTQAFLQEYFSSSDWPLVDADHLGKLNDVLLPINSSLAFRLLTNLKTPYLLSSACEFVILNGRCTLERFNFNEAPTHFSWLKRITPSPVEKRVCEAGEAFELKAMTDGFYRLFPETISLLGHWNYQSPNLHHISGDLKFESFTLSATGRKLIKLSRNIYAKENRSAEEVLREEFFQLLNRISEADLVFIYATGAYLSSKAQQSDFHHYFSKRFPGIS